MGAAEDKRQAELTGPEEASQGLKSRPMLDAQASSQMKQGGLRKTAQTPPLGVFELPPDPKYLSYSVQSDSEAESRKLPLWRDGFNLMNPEFQPW